jgi:hypothetical protein
VQIGAGAGVRSAASNVAFQVPHWKPAPPPSLHARFPASSRLARSSARSRPSPRLSQANGPRVSLPGTAASMADGAIAGGRPHRLKKRTREQSPKSSPTLIRPMSFINHSRQIDLEKNGLAELARAVRGDERSAAEHTDRVHRWEGIGSGGRMAGLALN